MHHRIDFLWYLDPTGTVFTVEGSFRGRTLTTTVAAAAVTDQRQRQAIEEEMAVGLGARIDGRDTLEKAS
ncbi:MAG: hypothetical protein H7338_02780 [Candidatus Sericytochromatia bacterium]|nr:hypothetical protein [Candidatus Sericytochromatia bacterium]